MSDVCLTAIAISWCSSHLCTPPTLALSTPTIAQLGRCFFLYITTPFSGLIQNNFLPTHLQTMLASPAPIASSMDKENNPQLPTLERRYREKQRQLRHYQDKVDRIKFELKELEIALENEKLDTLASGNTGHDIYKQAHNDTTSHLKVLSSPARTLQPQNSPLQQLRHKASALNEEWNPVVQQLGNELNKKTSQLWTGFMNLSPQRPTRRDPLAARVLFDQEVVDIDDYESDY